VPKSQLLVTITIPVIKPQNARKSKPHAQIQVSTPALTSLAPGDSSPIANSFAGKLTNDVGFGDLGAALEFTPVRFDAGS